MRHVVALVLLALFAAACSAADESTAPDEAAPELESSAAPAPTAAPEAEADTTPPPEDNPDPIVPTAEVTGTRFDSSLLDLLSTPVGVLIVSSEPLLLGPDGTKSPVRFPSASTFYGVGQCVEDPAFECAVEVIAWDHAQNCLALDIPTGDVECWSADTLTDEQPEFAYTIAGVCPGGSAEMLSQEFLCEPDLPIVFDAGPTFVTAGTGIIRYVRDGVAQTCWQQGDLDFAPVDVAYDGDEAAGVLTITGRNIFTDLEQTLTLIFNRDAALAGDRCGADNPVTASTTRDPTFRSDGRAWSWSSDFTVREPAQEGPLRVSRRLDDGTIQEFVIDSNQPIWGTPVVTLDDDYVYVAIQRTQLLDDDDQPTDTFFYEDQGFLRFANSGPDGSRSRLFRVPLDGDGTGSEELDIATQPAILENERMKFISAMTVDDLGLIVADLESRTLYRFPPGSLVGVS